MIATITEAIVVMMLGTILGASFFKLIISLIQKRANDLFIFIITYNALL